MKKFFISIVVFGFLLTSLTKISFAHLAGQPPFFQINGKLAAQYNVPSTSLEDFPLPQDIGVDRYLVNTPIQFHIQSEVLGVPADIARDTVFAWDYGDGTKGVGLTNTHTYSKPGSYTLAIDAVYGGDSSLIESVLLQVLPSADYKLPLAVLLVNGKGSTDPLVDVLHFPFKTKLTFDGSKSVAGSAKIVSYRWDFGDGEQSRESVFTHTYNLDSDMVFPDLRVVDENGFISDTFVQINKTTSDSQSGNEASGQNTVTNAPNHNWIKISIALVFILFLACGAFVFLLKGKKRRRR